MVNAKRYLFPCPMRSAGKNTWNDLYHGGREREREGSPGKKGTREVPAPEPGRGEKSSSPHWSGASTRRWAPSLVPLPLRLHGGRWGADRWGADRWGASRGHLTDSVNKLRRD